MNSNSEDATIKRRSKANSQTKNTKSHLLEHELAIAETLYDHVNLALLFVFPLRRSKLSVAVPSPGFSVGYFVGLLVTIFRTNISGVKKHLVGTQRPKRKNI